MGGEANGVNNGIDGGRIRRSSVAVGGDESGRDGVDRARGVSNQNGLAIATPALERVNLSMHGK
jgi:hypothetical protein